MPSASGDANAQNILPVRMPVGRSHHNRLLEARAGCRNGLLLAGGG